MTFSDLSLSFIIFLTIFYSIVNYYLLDKSGILAQFKSMDSKKSNGTLDVKN
jgi:hypothetical protein